MLLRALAEFDDATLEMLGIHPECGVLAAQAVSGGARSDELVELAAHAELSTSFPHDARTWMRARARSRALSEAALDEARISRRWMQSLASALVEAGVVPNSPVHPVGGGLIAGGHRIKVLK